MGHKKVVVAMSGGVDSSVVAALLVEQGYDVTGMMLRLWSEPGSEAENRCCTPDALALARRVAGRLSIPFYAIDARQAFREIVVQSFIDGYTHNTTPNPCLVCNRHLRWDFLLQRALASGAEYLATGHYARLQTTSAGVQLLRGRDEHKDQSYVLHALNQAQLQRTIFPLGTLTKPEVRILARKFNLPVAERPDSQDLCFLGASDIHDFLIRHAPFAANPGPILDQNGVQLGIHQGLAFYTIGQRKGLRIAAPHPLYVLQKDASRNALIIGPAEELGQAALVAINAHWISGQAPISPFRAQVKIRYKARLEYGLVTPQPSASFHVHFDSPLRDITPGQAAVLYDGEVCLGGGTISSTPTPHSLE